MYGLCIDSDESRIEAMAKAAREGCDVCVRVCVIAFFAVAFIDS